MLESFLSFLDRSPTVYHAAKEVQLALAEADFTPLAEGEKWDLEPGKGYFVTREDSLVAAFRMPKKKATHAVLLASHLDSPALRLKPIPEIITNEIGQLGTELYGAPILASWLDRNLAIGGRILTADKQGRIESKLVLLDDYPVVIPNLAIHLQREVNEKGLIVHKQDHLKAIFGLKSKKEELIKQLKKQHSFQTLLSFDLFLSPTEKSAIIGFEREFITSYHLDNLTSAFASLYALTESKPHAEKLQMALFWDHEEIGSQTYAGADSLFVDQLLERIHLSREEIYRLKSRSICLSVDVGHAVHPNFPDKTDPQNGPRLGEGPVVKFSSRYATTGATAAPVALLAKKAKIPLQMSASRSDLPGGSTVGAMMGAMLGIPTVDLGVGCLGMHSIRETIAVQDEIYLCHLLREALA